MHYYCSPFIYRHRFRTSTFLIVRDKHHISAFSNNTEASFVLWYEHMLFIGACLDEDEALVKVVIWHSVDGCLNGCEITTAIGSNDHVKHFVCRLNICGE